MANKAISDSTDFLLVEGQLDAIRCWEEGFKTVIAPQGTAFKESQANLLKKSDPRRIVCLLDGDDAGKKAALSYVSIFMKSGLDARFATLPKGSDPDQVLEQSGPSALQKLIDEGKSSVQFVVDEKIEKVSEATPMIRKKVSEFFYEPLCELESFVVQDGFLEEIAKTMMITPDSVKQDFLSFQKNFRKRRSYRQQEKESNKRAERLTTVEDDLLYTILHNDRLASPLAQSIDLLGSIRLVHREKFWSNFLLKHLPTDRYPLSKSKASWKTTKKERLFNIFYSMKPSTTKRNCYCNLQMNASASFSSGILNFPKSKLSMKSRTLPERREV